MSSIVATTSWCRPARYAATIVSYMIVLLLFMTSDRSIFSVACPYLRTDSVGDHAEGSKSCRNRQARDRESRVA